MTASDHPLVLQQNTAQKEYSKQYKKMVHKWRHHFYGVIDNIIESHGNVSTPMNFEPLMAYFDGFKITHKSIEAVPQSILDAMRCDDEKAEGWNWINTENAEILIFFDPSVGTTRQRFTKAHEWAHVVQSFDGEFKADMESIEDDQERSAIIESVANHFAGYYLVPQSLVLYELRNDPLELHKPTVNHTALACTFGVSEQVINYRLANVPIKQKQ
ncbi:MAG: hypothetical protein COW24_01025 [Candidatus Kerfeldbacteria bacterium CG15_BIG_FIL_POST_REV_8_21_14_020_45_12]|uniref:IrrE N-terminal-like domain-containing protein n=1 Tax=Candidatus Kerfeldbacteria bacterium CG15_BIG_FIL_POST_REV_8_21_14_020_45_12 TaxID=2014247 RepID=A0A2M7H4W8_9BACT|nr:MAG: hypothetical protein COW24_01025 [Candidatus Kerfeldbacteria bacterium CG15_BIG_FIL_POST_REV_8_21_14_020_45_12]PJA93787.1 MAG: hypothetical protein CO132_01510 [Candidatus Kerfeldbacteria bacterium CG_4_9_14_3_um_filter_45_8]